jgi:hypothetical protein
MSKRVDKTWATRPADERRPRGINVSRDEFEELQRIAKDLNYLQTTGSGAYRDGNVSEMLRAIARKELLLTRAEGAGGQANSPAQ